MRPMQPKHMASAPPSSMEAMAVSRTRSKLLEEVVHGIARYDNDSSACVVEQVDRGKQLLQDSLAVDDARLVEPRKRYAVQEHLGVIGILHCLPFSWASRISNW